MLGLDKSNNIILILLCVYFLLIARLRSIVSSEFISRQQKQGSKTFFTRWRFHHDEIYAATQFYLLICQKISFFSIFFFAQLAKIYFFFHFFLIFFFSFHTSWYIMHLANLFVLLHCAHTKSFFSSHFTLILFSSQIRNNMYKYF